MSRLREAIRAELRKGKTTAAQLHRYLLARRVKVGYGDMLDMLYADEAIGQFCLISRWHDRSGNPIPGGEIWHVLNKAQLRKKAALVRASIRKDQGRLKSILAELK